MSQKSPSLCRSARLPVGLTLAFLGILPPAATLGCITVQEAYASRTKDQIAYTGCRPQEFAAFVGGSGMVSVEELLHRIDQLGMPCVELLRDQQTRGLKMDGRLLRRAAAEASPEAVAFALDSGVPTESRDAEGRTALHHALIHQGPNHMVDVVELLINRHADVNAQDNTGRTPLFYASRTYAAPEVIKRLKAVGADTKIRNKDGRTAVEEAEAYHLPAWKLTELKD